MEEKIKKMHEFGLLVGKAFQIRDDLFGYLSFDTGKPSLNDFKQAKITLPLIHTLSKVDTSTKRKIIKNLKKYRAIDEIIEIVKENDGINYSEKKMIKMIDEAYSILKKFPDSEYKKSLISLLNYIIKRNI